MKTKSIFISIVIPRLVVAVVSPSDLSAMT